MTMVLTRIDDPRDGLSKARRKELEKFAEANGVVEITPGMPADIMRRILRLKGLTKITVPPRPLGGSAPEPEPLKALNGPVVPASDGTDATDELMRQWMQQKDKLQAPEENEKTPERKMTIGQLRKECKARGIVMVRTDTAASLRMKLESADK